MLTLFSQVRKLSAIGHSTKKMCPHHDTTWTACRKKFTGAFCFFSFRQSVCQLAAEEFTKNLFFCSPSRVEAISHGNIKFKLSHVESMSKQNGNFHKIANRNKLVTLHRWEASWRGLPSAFWRKSSWVLDASSAVFEVLSQNEINYSVIINGT